MIILGIDPGMAETGWGIIRMADDESALSVMSVERPAGGWRMAKSKKNGLKLVDYGCIKTLVGHDLSSRLLVLKKELQKIIVKHKPDCLAMEQLFFGRNAKTAMIVGLARGVMMVTAAEETVPIFEYQGLTVKLNLSGDGRCSKSGMQDTVRKILNLKSTPRPQHAADALAIAIYHVVGKKEKDESRKKK